MNVKIGLVKGKLTLKKLNINPFLRKKKEKKIG